MKCRDKMALTPVIVALLLINSALAFITFDHLCVDEHWAAGVHPHPTLCHKFIECANGIGYQMDCPAGLAYNHAIKGCDDPVKMGCYPGGTKPPAPKTTTRRPIVTLNHLCVDQHWAAGIHPHPSKCHKFIECSNGIAYEMDCPSGLAYNAVLKTCDDPVKVNCGTGTGGVNPATTTTTTRRPLVIFSHLCVDQHWATGLHPHPTECHKFIECANGVAYEMVCPVGLAYNHQALACDDPVKMNCFTPPLSYPQAARKVFKRSLNTFDYGHNPADIEFLLDSSGSVGAANFQTQLDFVKNFANSFQIGPNAIQIGVATFSSQLHNQFWMNQHPNKAALIRAIDNINYDEGGDTFTELGLKFVRNNAFTKTHGDRDRVANILIVVTDGKSSNPAKTKAEVEEIHKENINIFAIGVGNGVDRSELELIASSPQNVFTVSNTQALHTIQASLKNKTIKIAGTKPPTPKTTTRRPIVTLNHLCVDQHWAAGIHPHPSKCHKFIECSNGIAYEMDCPSGLAYNAVLKTCDDPVKVNCGTGTGGVNPATTTTTRRPLVIFSHLCVDQHWATGLHPHPTECHKFIECANGVAYEMVCPVGLAYNHQALACDDPVKMNCFTAPLSYPQAARMVFRRSPNTFDHLCVDQHWAAGVHPHPSNCHKFIECANGISYIMDCPAGLAYNDVIKTCDNSQTTGCQSGTKTSGDINDICRDQNLSDGIHTHPFECHKYIECSFRRTYVMGCPSGLVYDPNTKTCEAANIAPPCQNGNRHAATTAPSAIVPKTVCSDLSLSQGVHPHPTHCEKYIECAAGSITYEMNCPPGLQYKKDAADCEQPENVRCQDNVDFFNDLVIG